MKEYAIAYENDNSVALWVTGYYRSGTLIFDVINGCWKGFLNSDGIVGIEGEKSKFKAKVVWEGEVPSPHGRNYNEAIHWINQQIGCFELGDQDASNH